MSRVRSPWRLRTVGAAACVSLLAAACTGSSAGAPSRSPPGSRTPLDPYEQAFDNGEPCPVARAPGLPANVGCASDVRAELDGDARPDRFVVFASLDGERKPASWYAVALMEADGPTAVTAIPFGAQVEGQSDLYPRVVGAFDADGDGRQEVFVKLTGIVYHIAVSHIVGIFRVAGDEIRQVELDDGSGGRPMPWHFFTGGTSRRGQGVVCATVAGKPALLVRLIQVVPPERWSWSEQTLVWKDGVLVPDGSRHGFYPQSVSIADPRIVAFFKLRCGSVVLE